MRRCGADFLRTADGPHKSLMRHERMPALNIGTTPTSKTPWCSRPTTLSATAVWSLTPGTPISRSHSWQSAGPPPPAATARPTKPAAVKKPATPIWPGRRCTHCLTNRCRANPPIPAILWRFFDGQEKQKPRCSSA